LIISSEKTDQNGPTYLRFGGSQDHLRFSTHLSWWTLYCCWVWRWGSLPFMQRLTQGVESMGACPPGPRRFLSWAISGIFRLMANKIGYTGWSISSPMVSLFRNIDIAIIPIHSILAGPISSITVLGQTIVIVNDSKIAQDLLTKRSAIYSSRPRMTFASEMWVSNHNERTMLIQSLGLDGKMDSHSKDIQNDSAPIAKQFSQALALNLQSRSIRLCKKWKLADFCFACSRIRRTCCSMFKRVFHSPLSTPQT
jgi:hypothetical protein